MAATACGATARRRARTLQLCSGGRGGGCLSCCLRDALCDCLRDTGAQTLLGNLTEGIDIAADVATLEQVGRARCGVTHRPVPVLRRAMATPDTDSGPCCPHVCWRCLVQIPGHAHQPESWATARALIPALEALVDQFGECIGALQRNKRKELTDQVLRETHSALHPGIADVLPVRGQGLPPPPPHTHIPRRLRATRLAANRKHWLWSYR